MTVFEVVGTCWNEDGGSERLLGVYGTRDEAESEGEMYAWNTVRWATHSGDCPQYGYRVVERESPTI